MPFGASRRRQRSKSSPALDGAQHFIISTDLGQTANPSPPDVSQADLDWQAPRRVHMPIKCFETRLKLFGGELTLPRRYIYCTRITPADPFGQFARRARSEPGWRFFEIDASHSPGVTAPEALMELLEGVIAN